MSAWEAFWIFAQGLLLTLAIPDTPTRALSIVIFNKYSHSKVKMEIRSWIWIFAICTFSGAAESEENPWAEINSTDCWNYGRNRSIFEAPGVQNWNDCGRWNESGIAPWIVVLRTADDGDFVRSVLVSDQTIISFGWRDTLNAELKSGKEIKFYAGQCEDEKDGQKCFWKRSLQSKKVLDVKKVNVKYGSFFHGPIFVWRIEKVEFTPSLQPACLWNKDNKKDEQENFHFYDYLNETMGKLNYLPEHDCYSEKKIRKMYCDLYGNSICTSRPGLNWTQQLYLFVGRGGRFYLRALLASLIDDIAHKWLDLLPWTNEITSAAVDLQ
ncbi:uncharacterized protein LOC132195960 [Neocloeon triangulifer]|uniref:uncharacterized protein LOC132195960 n=1 Tax=Neocloeon triangulifer TaxID=2078957 RepID=UPI00286EB83E|nr:uncharacterized protein LOC132195960 [Neocloeon triangulifer]